MKRGCSFDESRDGVEITVFYPIRSLNANDYLKLNEVFTCKNENLHAAYLKRMTHLLTTNGCNKELLEIRDLIKNNVADSKEKQKVLLLYNTFANIMPGTQAPNVTFKDAEGKKYTINDFKGKIIVIDVWATWCSSCLKNMPKFMELIKDFKGNEDVVFFTVSTDSDDLKEKWLAAINKHKMGEMLNLTPDREAIEQFEEKYFVGSVPRYIVIDKEGVIVSAFAPKPGPALKEMIINSL
jgi:peroxiredoxin